MDTIPRFMEKLRASERSPLRAEPTIHGGRTMFGSARPAFDGPAAFDADWHEPRETEERPMDRGAPSGAPSPAAADALAIGNILVESGRLRPEDAQAVLREQAQQGAPFGTVALRLGLVTEADIDYALARQFEYPCLTPGSDIVDPSVVTAFAPHGEAAEHLRELRSQLALTWLDGRGSRKSLAITGVGRGEGRSFVAANLAVLFAQMGTRTLLVDADLRNPSQDVLFHMDNRVGLSNLLVGRAAGEAIVRVAALRNLYVLPSGPRPPNPQELLGRSAFARQLHTLEGLFDVVIVDTTAAERGADGQLVAAASGATLMVVRNDFTPMKELRAFHAALGAGGGHVLGAVVNRG